MRGLDNAAVAQFAVRQNRHLLLTLGDVGTDRHVPGGFALLVDKRHDGGGYPVQAAILGAVADIALPDLAVGDGLIQVDEKIQGVGAGIEQAVVLPQKLFARVVADGAKLVVDIGNGAPHIGHGNDGVLIQCKFLVSEFCFLTLLLLQSRFKSGDGLSVTHVIAMHGTNRQADDHTVSTKNQHGQHGVRLKLESKRAIRRKVEIRRHRRADQRDEQPGAGAKKNSRDRHRREKRDELQAGILRSKGHAQEQGHHRQDRGKQVGRQPPGLGTHQVFKASIQLIGQRTQK